MKQLPTSFRRQLSRWSGWFFAVNIIVLCLLSLSYVSVLPSFYQSPLVTIKGEMLAVVFTVLAFVGQFALFVGLAWLMVLLLTQLLPRRWFIFPCAIVLAVAMALFVVIDSAAYHLYHFHVGSIVWQVIQSGTVLEVLVLSKAEWTSLIVVVALLFAAESALALFIWRRLQPQPQRNRGRLLVIALAASLFLSYTMYLSAGEITEGISESARSNDHLLVMIARVVPYYNQVLGLLLPEKDGALHLMTLNESYFVENKQVSRQLKYPLKPLNVVQPKRRYNIVVIGIDTWRFDMMNAKVSPNIAALAKKSWVFDDNFSGGNCTRPGIFSLFYSIPANYWTAMLQQKRGPVFIKQLLKDHYQMGVYGSASLNFPAFDKTVFRAVPNLQVNTPGNSSPARDKEITKEFNQFVVHRNKKQPFFGFLFYDSVHNWCGEQQTFAKPFQPAIKVCNRMFLGKHTNPLPYLNRYKNAVLFDDGLVGKVIANLKKQHLLKNTIIVITADHGEQFNDEHMGYWGHASTFDQYEVRTPMIVYWPGKKHRVISYRTSHYDVVPTLMRFALGVKNPYVDYSVGVPLLDSDQPDSLIIGSYIDYAIVDKNRITTIYPSGTYSVRRNNNQLIPGAAINIGDLRRAFALIHRYFQEFRT